MLVVIRAASDELIDSPFVVARKKEHFTLIITLNPKNSAHSPP
jgi:hypothetical protein